MSKFIRLHIIAEGQTEERFTKDTLSNYLGSFNISTDVRCIQTSKNKYKRYRGGLTSYAKAKSDIMIWLKEDGNSNVRFTTMFDLYALPKDFPKYNESKKINDAYERVEFLEKAFADDIQDNRFIPYIQLYEFETLILSKPEELKIEYFERSKEISNLQKLLAEKVNPELINDNPETAPSKRIIKLIPEYDKVSVGAVIVGKIGIDFLKKTCSHFNGWIAKLENLSSITNR